MKKAETTSSSRPYHVTKEKPPKAECAVSSVQQVDRILKIKPLLVLGEVQCRDWNSVKSNI